MTATLLQIQIATALTETGVGDIRWVLLDSNDDLAPNLTPPAVTPLAATEPVGPEHTAMATEAAAVQNPAAADALGRTDPIECEREPKAEPEPESDPHTDLTYQVLRAIVLVAALAAAWWTASSLLEHRSPSNAATAVSRPAAP